MICLCLVAHFCDRTLGLSELIERENALFSFNIAFLYTFDQIGILLIDQPDLLKRRRRKALLRIDHLFILLENFDRMITDLLKLVHDREGTGQIVRNILRKFQRIRACDIGDDLSGQEIDDLLVVADLMCIRNIFLKDPFTGRLEITLYKAGDAVHFLPDLHCHDRRRTDHALVDVLQTECALMRLLRDDFVRDAHDKVRERKQDKTRDHLEENVENRHLESGARYI